MNNEIQVPDKQRRSTPRDLFFIWFANNIGILGIVMGTMIVGYELNFYQSLMVAALGAGSFALVGWIGVIGQKTGITTFVLSRAPFGIKGNIIPNFVAWLNLIGWLAVNIVTGTLILNVFFQNLLGIEGTFVTLFSLAIFVALVLLSGRIDANRLAKVQTILTYVFGALTLLVLWVLLRDANWGELLARPAGGWASGFWPAVSIIAAGTGINWAIAGADYGAYQKQTAAHSSVFWSTTIGAFIPLFVILTAGIILGNMHPAFITAANPMLDIHAALPSGLGLVYLLTAVGGLIPQCIVSLQSANMNLASLNIHMSQKTSMLLHGLLMVTIALYVLFFSASFLSIFETFLGLLGILLAAWAAVFLVDYLINRRQKGYNLELLKVKGPNQANWPAISSWLVGVGTGFLFTNNQFFTGPFATGLFADNSLGVLLAMIVSATLMWLTSTVRRGHHAS